jgi:hypothetical protein
MLRLNVQKAAKTIDKKALFFMLVSFQPCCFLKKVCPCFRAPPPLIMPFVHDQG